MILYLIINFSLSSRVPRVGGGDPKNIDGFGVID